MAVSDDAPGSTRSRSQAANALVIKELAEHNGRVICPFCQRELLRKEVEMWGSFPCPHCHKLLRIRKNYTIRILRLALITAVLLYLVVEISDWFRQHLGIGIFVTGGTIGLIDEYVMRLLPAKVEPAVPGGFTAS